MAPRCIFIIIARTDNLPKIHMNVKNGVFTSVDIDINGVDTEKCHAFGQMLVDKRNLHEIQDWPSQFEEAGLGNKEALDLAHWISKMLPVNR